ncbi:MAG TPA: Spy/CpxP family protein refolding chaperone [Polyangia bacterium]|jgi:Spy/CpxP family protein refolding chaperone|nr:Spy/CpxP family protein refolding chaperone [Polyangia bacterium]
MNTGSPTTKDPETLARPSWHFGRRTALLLAVPLLLVGGVSLRAVAHEGGPDGGMHGGGMRHRMLHMLEIAGATDAQKAQIKAVWEPLRPQLRSVAEEHMKVRQNIRQALAAATIDPSAIEKLRQSSVQLMDKRSTLVTQGMVATAQILSADQRQKIATEIAKHAGEHHGFGEGAAP